MVILVTIFPSSMQESSEEVQRGVKWFYYRKFQMEVSIIYWNSSQNASNGSIRRDRILKVVKHFTSLIALLHPLAYDTTWHLLRWRRVPRRPFGSSVTIYLLRTYSYSTLNCKVVHCSLNLLLDLVWGLINQIIIILSERTGFRDRLMPPTLMEAHVSK